VQYTITNVKKFFTIHLTLKVDVPDTNTMLKTITQHGKQNSDNYNGFQRCYGQGKDN